MTSSIVKTKVFLFLTAVLFSVFLAGSVFAQSGTSTVNGLVTDQNGGAVPGATVRLTNPETGFSRDTITNSDGFYSFPTIPPGTYRVEIEAKNFKKTINSNVKAVIDSTVETNFALEAGEVSAVVDVTSNTIESIVNTQDATLGNNFVPQQITQLPTDLRRVTNLLSLQPGVTADGYVNGGRSDQANITLDGVDVNDQQTGAAFQTILRVTTESIEEFRITTVNPNASQGRSSGAQISLLTKSGTNKFRGVVFEFYRPTALSANNFFNNAAGVDRPSLARHVYGGAIGGPIVKDKFFFFYSYEGQRERREESVVNTVPLASLGRGELRFRNASGGITTLTTAQLNTIFPAVGINPAAVSVLAAAAGRYAANDFVSGFGDGLNTGGYRFNDAVSDDENTHIFRLDYNLNAKQQLFFRGNYQSDLQTGGRAFPDTLPIRLWEHPTGFVVGHNWTISNNKVNNFRYGLTRQAFTSQGDSTENEISFRFVFQPTNFTNSLSRVTPVQNFTDDFTWVVKNHTFQFGGNVRLISNQRQDLGRSFDSAITNPSFYESSGRVLDRPVTAAGFPVPTSQRSVVQNAAAALIGRFSQYTANFNYDLSGNVLPVGTQIEREFATEEYDAYIQDSWKVTRNLNVTLGLRYGLSRPVYEKNGYMVRPNIPLGEFLERRIQGAESGRPYNGLLDFELAGPSYDKPGFYSMDKNNFQPRVAAAWSPNFKNKFLKGLFGGDGKATFRGGFSITNDYFGQQLAVTFDQLSTLGFTTSDTIAANTYNVTDNPGPRFTGFGQNVRVLPNISAPNRFMTPADEDQRIESSLDSTLVSPTHYTWSFSYGRQLPKGLYVEASYIGRKARNLLATRDALQQNNLRDSRSGMDWYTAAGMLADLRERNTPLSAVPSIAYFNNLFPNLGPSLAVFWDDPDYAGMTPTQAAYYMVARDGYDVLDWTFVQLALDDDFTGGNGWSNLFFHPQYAAFSAFSTVAKSDYHGGSLTVRQRLGETFSFDLNYTFAKSIDNASGLQTAGTYGSAFILNALRPDDNRALSDFDVRHLVNANFIFQVPIGKGRKYFNGMNSFADAFLGGWQLSGIYRWNTGLPAPTPFDAAQWATNWNVQSNGVRIRPIQSSATRSTTNLFSDPLQAYRSFRNARAGETGDRNVLRLPGFSTFDIGLSKTWTMPWNENHKLQFRTEVFNIANVQYLTINNVTRQSFGLSQDSPIGEPSTDSNGNYIFGAMDGIQGNPRRFQFGLRYSF